MRAVNQIISIVSNLSCLWYITRRWTGFLLVQFLRKNCCFFGFVVDVKDSNFMPLYYCCSGGNLLTRSLTFHQFCYYKTDFYRKLFSSWINQRRELCPVIRFNRTCCHRSLSWVPKAQKYNRNVVKNWGIEKDVVVIK